jgi:hypothetical protein
METGWLTVFVKLFWEKIHQHMEIITKKDTVMHLVQWCVMYINVWISWDSITEQQIIFFQD